MPPKNLVNRLNHYYNPDGAPDSALRTTGEAARLKTTTRSQCYAVWCAEKPFCTHGKPSSPPAANGRTRLHFSPDPDHKRGKTLHLTEAGQTAALPVIQK